MAFSSVKQILEEFPSTKKDNDSSVAVHEQTPRVEAFHVRDVEEHPLHFASETCRMLYLVPYMASNMAFAP